MSILLDLSAPRRYIQAKYDDLIFKVKFNPLKINKRVLITSGIILVAIVFTGDIVYAVDVNSAEYKYLINHYTNNLHYPKDVVIDYLSKFEDFEIKKLYRGLKGCNDTLNNFQFCFDVTVKGVKAIDRFLTLCDQASKYVTFTD